MSAMSGAMVIARESDNRDAPSFFLVLTFSVVANGSLHVCGVAGTSLRLCALALDQRNAKTRRHKDAKDE